MTTRSHGSSVFRKNGRFNKIFGITEMKVNGTTVGYQVTHVFRTWDDKRYRTQNVVKGLTFKTLESAREFLSHIDANRGMDIGITSTVIE